MLSYEEFLGAKREEVAKFGFEPTGEIAPFLFPHQRDIVAWGLRRGRGAVFADTGLGKTLVELEWSRHVAKHTGGRVLILAPLAVAKQTVREANAFGMTAEYAKTQAESSGPVVVTNYERLANFNPSDFVGIVLDECFAPETLVDVVRGGAVVPTAIANVREGDMVVNAVGVDRVADVHRREVPYAVRVSVNGQRIVCSPNHPWFTQRGWVCAQDIVPGDAVLRSAEAVHMVRQGVHAEVEAGIEHSQILRDILLSEVADESAGDSGACAQPRGCGKTGSGSIEVASLGGSESERGDRADAGSQPVDMAWRSREDIPNIESDAPRTFRAWGQRARFDEASTDASGCARTELDSGICLVVGETASRLSSALQARLGVARAANLYRGGWVLASQPEGSGPEEGRDASFARVDGIEILEPGHPDLERLRSADGKLYFYDLGATRHPSFSVGGCLVHNSSILKAFMGSTKRELVAAFKSTPFKLACTATPAPNDHMELGNHSEFLGVLSGHEMLQRWFINDTSTFGTYRLKGHAVEAFWDWVASWAVMVGKPSDMGHSDDGFVLPELTLLHHGVEADITEHRGDKLFRIPELSATSYHREKRLTVQARAAQVAELVAAEPEESWLVWCDTDYEADALMAAIPNATEVRGSDKPETKESRLIGFTDGSIRVLVTKPSLAGLGLNFQHCARMAFIGPTYSYEAYYQAIRRCWRFGQKRPVNVHLVMAQTEREVWNVLVRKADDHERMKREMFKAARRNNGVEARRKVLYEPHKAARLPQWLKSSEAA